jgi:hypothetical protein
LKPVIADESVMDVETLRTAREMGYTGVALKAGKGLSASLLVAAAAQKWGMSLVVMDLTCPGPAFLASATLASRIPGVHALEANARQYLPREAHGDGERRAPELFQVSQGMVRTAGLAGPGLGMTAPTYGTVSS